VRERTEREPGEREWSGSIRFDSFFGVGWSSIYEVYSLVGMAPLLPCGTKQTKELVGSGLLRSSLHPNTTLVDSITKGLRRLFLIIISKTSHTYLIDNEKGYTTLYEIGQLLAVKYRQK
jgi:hypothetical protein